jgi:hypothetical protein
VKYSSVLQTLTLFATLTESFCWTTHVSRRL